MENNNLDFMRTFLALGVLFGHSLWAIGISIPQLPLVPAFISLSGYLITGSMFDSRGVSHFAWKRFLRIFPAFAVSLLLVHLLGGSVWGALTDWVSTLIDIQPAEVNPPLWSLSVEESLYLSLAALFYAGAYRNRRTAIAVLSVLFVLSTCLSYFYGFSQLRLHQVGMCFIVGSALYVLKDNVPWSATLGLVSMVVAFLLRNYGNGTYLYSSMISIPTAYGFVYFAFYAKPIFGGYKRCFGDPCFGLYVYHFPIMIYISSKGIGGFELVALTFLFSFAMAQLSWRLLEKHALKLKGFSIGRLKYEAPSV